MAGYPPLFPQAPPGAPTYAPTQPAQITRIPQAVPVTGQPLVPMANPPAVPPAVAAAQRKNQKIDDKRKEGTKARQILQQQAPAALGPGPNSTTDTPPQMAPPPPAAVEDQAKFTPAQYKPPNKGLEYLALGIGMLFPGAPIARLAAGFAGGLNQGAQQGYQRAEQQAEQQYGAQKDANAVKFQNAEAARQAAVQKNETDFANQQIKFQQAQAQRQSGIDPVTGKPFVVPAPLAAPMSPTASSADRFNRESQLSAFYRSVGATDQAAVHDAAAKDWAEQARADSTQAAAWQRTLYTAQQSLNRTILEVNSKAQIAGAEMSQRERLHYDTEYNENYRFAVGQIEKNAGKTGELTAKAQAAQTKLMSSWRTLTADPVFARTSTGALIPLLGTDGKPMTNPDGTPAYKVEKPAPISDPNLKKALTGAFKTLGDPSVKDPSGMANFLAGRLNLGMDAQGSAARQLLSEAADAQIAARMAQGQPIVQMPAMFYTVLGRNMDKQQAQMTSQLLRSVGLNPSDPNVKSKLQEYAQAFPGVPLDAEAAKALRDQLHPAGAAAAPPNSPLFQGGNGSALGALLSRLPKPPPVHMTPVSVPPAPGLSQP